MEQLLRSRTSSDSVMRLVTIFWYFSGSLSFCRTLLMRCSFVRSLCFVGDIIDLTDGQLLNLSGDVTIRSMLFEFYRMSVVLGNPYSFICFSESRVVMRGR